jgi:hypothetical protein
LPRGLVVGQLTTVARVFTAVTMSWKAFVSRNLQSVKIMADPVAQGSAAAR